MWRRFHHRDENIGAGRVVVGEEGIVLVVARVRTQLRRTRIEVTDTQVLSAQESYGKQRDTDDDRYLRDRRFCEIGDERPQSGRLFLPTLDVGHAVVAEPCVGQQNRHKQQVCEDQNGDANARRQGKFLDDGDLDDHQGKEADAVRDQRDETRDMQSSESTPCRPQGADAEKEARGDVVDDLHAMADADREHEERHKHGIRIQAIPHRAQQPQLPHHRYSRAQQRYQGRVVATRIQQQQDLRYYECGQEEQRDLRGTLDQVADDFREPGNANTDRVRLVLIADQLLDTRRKFAVVEPLARFRIGVGQRRDNRGRPKVVGDESTDLARPQYVGLELVKRLW